MGARLINAKKKARRRRHKKSRDRAAVAPAQEEYNGAARPQRPASSR